MITKQEVLENLDEVKKYIQEAENKKEEIVKGLEIKNRWTGEVKFISTKTTYKEACEDNKANLREADLCEANLRGANLRGADLCGANLRGADLCEANLCEANLREANLYEANLRGADLYEANLRGANLRGADLCGADLYEANLYEADLCGAELMNTKFTGKGGTTKIRKNQVDDFFNALGVIVED